MTTARTPTARLSDCASELSDAGLSLDINRTEERVFYVKPEKSAERTDEDLDYLREFVRQIATDGHNLHFFEHAGKWAIATAPREDSQAWLF